MNIIVCLKPTRQFGRINNNSLLLVDDLNKATKFEEGYSEDLSYYLVKFREKYKDLTNAMIAENLDFFRNLPEGY